VRDAPAPASLGAQAGDVVIMRALAHPARLALLEYLADSGPATATECADVVGLSPSAVSYHLRALARAGLVEAAPGRGDGRERLWRRSTEHSSIEVDAGPDLDPVVREARQQLLESVLARDDGIARRYLGRIDDEPEEWREAMFVSSTLLLTAAELKALGTAVQELLAPYRRASRPVPPEGARPVSAVVRVLPR
jgi:DNA-binding transcriptional ArsR family regulator